VWGSGGSFGMILLVPLSEPCSSVIYVIKLCKTPLASPSYMI
jgi:hypothetical protein